MKRAQLFQKVTKLAKPRSIPRAAPKPCKEEQEAKSRWLEQEGLRLAEEAAGDRKGDRASDRAAVADEETPSCLAHEIRPAVLGAESALKRLTLAKTCIVDACYRLKGGKWPMDSYYW